LGVVLFFMLPQILQFSFIFLFFLGVIIGLSLLVVGIVWRRSRNDPDYRVAWANYRDILRRVATPAAGPAPGSAYLVGVVAGALVLVSSLGLGLYPCGWLDTLLQRSGCVRTLTLWPQISTALAVAPDDTLLAYSTHDEVKLLRPPGGGHIHTFANPGSGRDLAFSPDSALLAVGGGWKDDHVRIWRVSDGTLTQMLATDGTPSVLQFSPDGTLLATKSHEAVQLWRVADGTQFWTVPGGVYTGIAFTPDGSFLAVPGEAGIDLWRVADLTLARTLGEQATQITFAPDETVLVGIVERNQVQVWRVRDGALLHTLDWPQDRPNPDHFINISSVAVSPDSTLIAAGGRDHTVRLWRVSDGALVATLDQTDVVENLAFTSSGELVVGLRSGIIQVWRVR
jgi:WD40 repeat protein